MSTDADHSPPDGPRNASTAPQQDKNGTGTGQEPDKVRPNPPGHESGNVNATDGAEDSAGAPASREKETPDQVRARVWGRFIRERRDLTAMSLIRNRMMQEARKAIPDKAERQLWVYSELDRMYPPLTESPLPNLTDTAKQGVSENPNRTMSYSNQSSDGPIQGLGEIPTDWPDLPANASLSAEVGWVQANRLRIVEERPGRATLVRLDRALSPAPSWAALGWLETSIRSYAKFVDVAAKAASTDDGESSVVRRERLAIEEVEALLAEMLPGPPCPVCGRATPPT